MRTFKQGFIYVVQMEGHDLYKIGRSVNVPRRMSEFGVQLPFKHRLLFAHRIPDAVGQETWLHRDFGRYRANGEWFKLIPEHVEVIRWRLLLVQVNALIGDIQERFADEDLYASRLERYAILFTRLSRRLERRLRGLHSASVGAIQRLENAPSIRSAEGLVSELVS